MWGYSLQNPLLMNNKTFQAEKNFFDLLDKTKKAERGFAQAIKDEILLCAMQDNAVIAFLELPLYKHKYDNHVIDEISFLVVRYAKEVEMHGDAKKEVHRQHHFEIEEKVELLGTMSGAFVLTVEFILDRLNALLKESEFAMQLHTQDAMESDKGSLTIYCEGIIAPVKKEEGEEPKPHNGKVVTDEVKVNL